MFEHRKVYDTESWKLCAKSLDEVINKEPTIDAFLSSISAVYSQEQVKNGEIALTENKHETKDKDLNESVTLNLETKTDETSVWKVVNRTDTVMRLSCTATDN